MEYGASHWFSGVAYQRALGLVYLLAFLNAFNQFCALHGERGLEPAKERLSGSQMARAPSLFHLYYSDRFFTAAAAFGICLSLCAASGLSDSGPIWLSMLTWGLLWVLYLSIVNAGGTFYGFGWESKLLDAGFLAIFLGPSWMHKPLVVIFLVRWLLFRVELGAGLIKMRGAPCWRNLTCMLYHHETQPMPNPLSWTFHNSPAWMHKLETLGNHIVQLGVVWLIFAPQPIASYAGAVIILSQLWLLLSGNYAWLNFMTIAVALPTLGDGVLSAALGVTTPAPSAAPAWFEMTGYAVAALIGVLSIQPIRNLFSPHQKMNHSFNPFHLVNAYGAFGSVTKQRHELVIEATSDEVVTHSTDWHEYEFKGKPTKPSRMPPQIAPYHLRLDWQLWFVPLRPSLYPRWFLVFLKKLLECDSQTLRLLARSPFSSEAPARHVRVSLYHYRFTTRAERRQTGDFWRRTPLREYLPALDRASLDELLTTRPAALRSIAYRGRRPTA